MHVQLTEKGARSLRCGAAWLPREAIARTEGELSPGHAVELRDPSGERVAIADVDPGSPWPVRRLGMFEETLDGVIQRNLRRAIGRRSQLVKDPRFCRMVNDDGDGLPGLVIDRYDGHWVVQTFTRAMDARVEEIARSLVELADARSVLLRNDRDKRARSGLPVTAPHALSGSPPRWVRVAEGGARLTVDLTYGLNTGFFYDAREVRAAIGRLAEGARVLDVASYVGASSVAAGLHGARAILAFEQDRDALELARENVEANGLMGRVELQEAPPLEGLSMVEEPFDLVLLDVPHRTQATPEERAARFLDLCRLSIRHTRHGGRLVVSAYSPPLQSGAFDAVLSKALALEGRLGFRLTRPGLPPDFPTLIDEPGAEYLDALALELS